MDYDPKLYPLRTLAREICESNTLAKENPPPVLTKRDFTIRYQKGEFGNRTETYHTITELNNQGSSFKLYHLRNRIAGGTTYYNISWFEAIYLWEKQENMNNWYCSKMAPTEHTTFQGEVMESSQGLSLFYSTVTKPMRDALKEKSEQCFGLCAIMKFRQYLDPVDLDWIMILLERYKNHVVEFSTYSCKCGTLNRRTIIWEVRNY